MSRSRMLSVMVVMAFLSGCAPTGPFMKERPNYTEVLTFFATDRNVTGKTMPSEKFGDNRSSTLTYGECAVSIPPKHEPGELESPFLKLKFLENPERHVVLLGTALNSEADFFEYLKILVSVSTRKDAFLFVHGYNVTFEDAARRTAQIAYDLNFGGAPVFYSWPSQGKIHSYTVDENNIDWSQANLRGFLKDFFERSDAQNVYLIAHSMGNRALTSALASLMKDNPNLRERLKEVILAAPDIDAGIFKRDIAPALIATGRPITLYASTTDVALETSGIVHGHLRAGDSGNGLVVLQGMESIDATGVDTSFFGHSYIAGSPTVLKDVSNLILEGKRANQRERLHGKDSQAGRYWMFK